MEITNTMATMCQGSRLLGMSSKDEHVLESYLRKLLSHNGPDYAIAQLKTLKEITIRQIEDPNFHLNKDYFFNKQPLKWKWSQTRPKGPLSTIYKTWSKPETRVRGLGMLINSFTNEHITQKQLKKFLDGVNSDGKYCDYKVIPMTNRDILTFVSSLNRHNDKMPVFNGTDLTGSLLPYGNYSESIASSRKGIISTDPVVRHKAISVMSHALDGQVKYAPIKVKKYIKTHFKSYHDVKIDMSGTDNVARDYEYSLKYDMSGRSIDSDKTYAGTMSCLQKPGGKLRSVFNTNRMINHAMTPYARALEDTFYKGYPHHIFVNRQDKGEQSIQHMIRRGKSLVSADLTSATDLLNFRVFTNALREGCFKLIYTGKHLQDFNKSHKKPYWSLEVAKNTCKTLHSSNILDRNVDKTHKLKIRDVVNAIDAVNLFEETAQMPFYSKDFNSVVALRTGQPLGMMGSFQTLSSMNFCMGRYAEYLSHNRQFSKEIPQFAVVGDDFVGDASIMKAYSKIVKSYNGQDNHEKALHSKDHAEFLSHLITRNKIIDMKPKFRLGHNSLWINMDKTSSTKVVHMYRLNNEDKNSIETLGAIADPTGAGSRYVTPKKRLNREERNIINAALKRLSLDKTDSPDLINISQETVSLSRDEQQIDNKFVGSNLNFARKDKDDNQYHVVRPVQHHENDVYSPETSRYDHKLDKRVNIDDLKLANIASQKKNKARIANSLIDTMKNGNEHYNSIPHHSKSKVSNTAVLLDAIDSIETSSLHNNVVFPSTSNSNDENNDIDRQKQAEHNMHTAYSTEPNHIIVSAILDYTSYLANGRNQVLRKKKKDVPVISDKKPSISDPVQCWDDYDTFSKYIYHDVGDDTVRALDELSKPEVYNNSKLFQQKYNAAAIMVEHHLPNNPLCSTWYRFHSLGEHKHANLNELKQSVDQNESRISPSTTDGYSNDEPDL